MLEDPSFLPLPSTRTIARLVVAALLPLHLLAAGCGGLQVAPDTPPEELYRMAREALEEKRFDEAKTLGDRIRDEFPFSRYATEAELLAADASFADAKYEEAAAAYRSFEELHPTNERVPYAVYRRGAAYDHLSLPEDRDQTATRRAAEAFTKLLNAYPESEFAPEARGRLVELRSRLAAHELYVARYYIRKKRTPAALQRLRGLVQEFPETPEGATALRLALDLETKAAAGAE